MKRRPLGWVIATTAVLVLAAACGQSGSSGGSSAAGQTYDLSADLPLTGSSAIYGNEARMNIDLAIKQIDAAHLLKGHIVAHYADSQGSPQTGVLAANQEIATHHPVAIETLISSVVKAIAPIGARQQVSIMNVGGSSPDLVNLNPYSFTLLPTGQNQANIMVPFAAKNMNLKTWSIVYSTDALGQGFVPVLKSLLQQNGGRVVGTVAVDPDASDYSSIVPALRSQNAQAIFLGTSNGATVPTLVDQIRGGQVHGAFVAYNGTPTPDLYQDPRAEGMVYTAQDLDLSPTAKDKATADYVKAFKAAYPTKELFDYAANDYNAVWVLAYAIKHLEDTHQDVTGANVSKAMHDASPYTLVGGKTKLLSNNTLDMPLVIKKISHGAAVTLPDQG